MKRTALFLALCSVVVLFVMSHAPAGRPYVPETPTRVSEYHIPEQQSGNAFRHQAAPVDFVAEGEEIWTSGGQRFVFHKDESSGMFVLGLSLGLGNGKVVKSELELGGWPQVIDGADNLPAFKIGPILKPKYGPTMLVVQAYDDMPIYIQAVRPQPLPEMECRVSASMVPLEANRQLETIPDEELSNHGVKTLGSMLVLEMFPLTGVVVANAANYEVTVDGAPETTIVVEAVPGVLRVSRPCGNFGGTWVDLLFDGKNWLRAVPVPTEHVSIPVFVDTSGLSAEAKNCVDHITVGVNGSIVALFKGPNDMDFVATVPKHSDGYKVDSVDAMHKYTPEFQEKLGVYGIVVAWLGTPTKLTPGVTNVLKIDTILEPDKLQKVCSQ